MLSHSYRTFQYGVILKMLHILNVRNSLSTSMMVNLIKRHYILHSLVHKSQALDHLHTFRVEIQLYHQERLYFLFALNHTQFQNNKHLV